MLNKTIGASQFEATPSDFTGGGDSEDYTLLRKVSELVSMGGGDDNVTAPNKGLDAGDRIDGGAGSDNFVIQGKLGGEFDFGKATLTGFESIGIQGRGAFDLVLDKHMVADGSQLLISANSFFADDVLHIRVDGSSIRDGTLRLIGSGGDDVLIGGHGADLIGGDATGDDRLTGNGGADQFVFTSIVPQHALITDFIQGEDIIYTEDDRFSDLKITDSKAGAVVEIYDGVFATVKGVSASQLTAADFFFSGHDAAPPQVGYHLLPELHPQAGLLLA